MQRIDGWRERLGVAARGLAMAGKNPWGNTGKGDSSGGDEPREDGPGGDGPSGDRPGGSEGPRNPWLPGGGEPGKRRSASIDDIFKNRGGGIEQTR